MCATFSGVLASIQVDTTLSSCEQALVEERKPHRKRVQPGGTAMRNTVLLVLSLLALTGVSVSNAADEPVFMRDLANPPSVGSAVTLVRQFSLDPFLCDDYFEFGSYVEATKAKDDFGIKKTRGHFGKIGTTALILEATDQPISRRINIDRRIADIEIKIAGLSKWEHSPIWNDLNAEYLARHRGQLSEMKALSTANCVKIRITSGSEKGQSAYVDHDFIANLIPTRVRVGETGVLRKESAVAVRVFDRVETYDKYVSDWIALYEKYVSDQIASEPRGGESTSRKKIEEVDIGYSDAGKLLFLPDGVRVKILGFIEPGEHPLLSQTMASVEIITPPKNRKKLQGKKGYVRAFEVYKDDDPKTKAKRKR
jgi:hypothetical protein